MRNAYGRCCAPYQRMSINHLAIEYTRALFRQQFSFDAINAQHCGMRCQARPNSRGGMVVRPVDDLAQCLPVRLVLEVCRTGLGASDDQAVEVGTPQLADVAVTTGHVMSCRSRTRHFGNRE